MGRGRYVLGGRALEEFCDALLVELRNRSGGGRERMVRG
jgi:hypothetical protein